jgi:SAM-dependent methyltransferase
VCPNCRSRGLELGAAEAHCADCNSTFQKAHSIWYLLPPEREQQYTDFLGSYTLIRNAEGRNTGDPAICRDLPACPEVHPLSWQWRIRSRSFRSLEKLLKNKMPSGARILDLGAGVGWLSHRLFQSGFLPCAIDLSADESDGLGAARHYEDDWPRVVAEFDRIPLADGVADAVIFNASLHYSTDYATTLHEAMRVVRRGGLIVILDSPVYRDAASGQQMVEDQHSDFEQRFGTRSDALQRRGFLTWKCLATLSAGTGLIWSVWRPWYGWRWALRPLLARLRGTREPATFALIWASAP